MRSATSTTIESRKRSSQSEMALLYGVFGLLLFGPLAFGAVEPWSIFVVETGSAALFIFWIGRQILEGELKIRWNPVFLPMSTFGLLVLTQLSLGASAYPHDTVALTLLYFAYAMLCFLASQTLIREAQARSLAFVFSAYGAALASFALLQGISSNGKLYWMRQPRSGGWIYGPYVNHNHYAGLMEMLMPIPLVVSLSRQAPPRLRAAAGVAAAIMTGTVFLSGSRGGMIAIVIELVIMAAFLIKQKRGWRTTMGVVIFVVIIAALLTWLGGPELAQRIATVGPGHPELSADLRHYINRDGLKMFSKKPILGWGLGSFPIVYPQFRSFHTNFFVNEAHNDYLQLLVETGLLGFLTMLWLVATIYLRALKKIAGWAVDISSAVSLASILGVTGILVHSAVDFNLQIPANAALFYVFCTVAASEPFAKPARKRRTVRNQAVDSNLDSQPLQQPATNF